MWLPWFPVRSEANVCVFDAAGFQAAAGVHRRSGSPEVEHRRLLADGLGAERRRHRHDHQPGGERTSE